MGSRHVPLFLQLPPRYRPGLIDDLRRSLAAWPRDLKLAVGVRPPDWFGPPRHEASNALLPEREAARVLIDKRPIRDMPEAEFWTGSVNLRLVPARDPKPDVPLLPERTAWFVLVRCIGHSRTELNAPRLDEWAARMAAWLREGADVFSFCHSPGQTVSPLICRELHRRVGAL